MTPPSTLLYGIRKRHEWSWDIVSGHILTKIWQVSCSVDISCVCIDMFYRWIHGFRVPHDFLADMFGFRQVVEVHEALTLYLEAMWSCHVMVQIFLSQKLRNMKKTCWIQIQLSNSKRKDNKNNSRQCQVTSATVAFGAACEAFASCCQSEALPSAKTLIGF